MDPRTIQSLLNGNGFPCGAVDGVIGPATKTAVSRFQVAYAGPRGYLAVDGIAGPMTQAALAELPHLSAHFTVAELRSHPESGGNGTCYIRRELLSALEGMRSHMGGPLPIVDAYRDPAHNRGVGGAHASQHLYGLAADLAYSLHLSVPWVESLGLFSGIGDKAGVVEHVDVRHLNPSTNPTPGATPAAPARWHY